MSGLQRQSRFEQGDDVVVMVHGFLASAGVFRPLRAHLQRAGGVQVASFTHAPGVGIHRIARRLARLVIEMAVVGQIQRVLFDRDGVGLGSRHEPCRPVPAGDVVQIDEGLEMLVADVAAGYDERMVGVVGVEEPVVTRRLVGVLGREKGQVEAHVLGAEPFPGGALPPSS